MSFRMASGHFLSEVQGFKTDQKHKTISISCFSMLILSYTFVAFRFSLLNRLRFHLAPKSLQNRFKNHFKKQPRQELILDRFENQF